MNAVYGPSRTHDALEWVGRVLMLSLWATWSVARIVLFAILATFEPVIRWILSFAALGGFLTTALFFFAGPHGLKVSYGILLALSAGSAITLVLYLMLLRALEP
jgi:hypothetical protein